MIIPAFLVTNHFQTKSVYLFSESAEIKRFEEMIEAHERYNMLYTHASSSRWSAKVQQYYKELDRYHHFQL